MIRSCVTRIACAFRSGYSSGDVESEGEDKSSVPPKLLPPALVVAEPKALGVACVVLPNAPVLEPKPDGQESQLDVSKKEKENVRLTTCCAVSKCSSCA